MQEADFKTVTLEGANFKETWRAFDHPDGFWVDGALNCLRTGELDPILKFQVFKLGSVGGPLAPIVASIPRKIHKIVASYGQFPVELTALASLNRNSFLTLHKRNPLLLLLVARSITWQDLWERRYWAELLGKPWKEISEALGYHNSVGSLAAKVRDPQLLAFGYAQLFLTVVRKPEMTRLLRHVETITLDVLTVGLNLADEAVACPALLQSASKNDSLIPQVTEDATAIVQMRQRMGLNPAWPYRWVPELKILTYWRARLEEAAMEDGVSVSTVYPPPPIPPDSTWGCITTADELSEFAERWSNCGKSYHWRLLVGLTVIYFERDFSSTALCVVADCENDGWRVSQVLMPNNQPPAADVEERVRTDFEEALNAF